MNNGIWRGPRLVAITLDENTREMSLDFGQGEVHTISLGPYEYLAIATDEPRAGAWDKPSMEEQGNDIPSPGAHPIGLGRRVTNWRKLAAELARALHNLAIVPVPFPRGWEGGELDQSEAALAAYRAASGIDDFPDEGCSHKQDEPWDIFKAGKEGG